MAKESVVEEEKPLFPAIERTSIGLQAVKAIRDAIVAGQLRPGQALPPERELAKSLGISRPSVREAIQALRMMNILESRQGGGTCVTSLDPVLLSQPIWFLLQVSEDSLLHLFELRQALEVSAARLAATRITEEELAALEVLVQSAEKVIDLPEDYITLDFEIHASVIRALHNPLYLSVLDGVSQLLLESRRRTARSDATRKAAHRSHVEILTALRDHDAEAAADAMERHLRGIDRALRSSGGSREKGATRGRSGT